MTAAVQPGLGRPSVAEGQCGAHVLHSRVNIGLRDLRQRASELVRRAEQGEAMTVTVSGRPAARLVPIEPRMWRRSAELTPLYGGAEDPGWAAERDRVDASPRDPWPV